MAFNARMCSSAVMLAVAAMHGCNPAWNVDFEMESRFRDLRCGTSVHMLHVSCRCLHVSSLANNMTTNSNEVLCSLVHGKSVANVPQQLT